ncbi:RNA exonuclease 5 isoform X2 [Denticeps clupeoides]|uniref:RRM domain-containing protein n=2 Tax=Denticeps clupeoides TaxID=299321 RepID=A0AAY4B7D9_9TELE|nr:RNA exonuclease 5 isoform X2 [Denticeps clupeoides]
MIDCGKRKRSTDYSPAEKSPKGGSPKTRREPRLSRTFTRLHEVVTLADLSELIQYATLGKTLGLRRPSWCHLHRSRKLSGVTVTILEGASQAHFYRYYAQCPNLRKWYKTRCTLTPCAGDVASAIFNSEMLCSRPASADKSGSAPDVHKDDLSWHPVIQTFGSETRGMTAYLLTSEQMSKHKFPLKGAPGCCSFLSTNSDGHVTDGSPLYGLDCEMCLTAQGYEVTRVAVVDSAGRCVLDELVKPDQQIINYITKISGITRTMLQPVTTRLADVQSQLIQLLPHDAVLVGHSLDCDLRALQLIHPHVIDSSLLYRREFNQRFKLKHLSAVLLNREIQSAERSGHDPTEDAVAALNLVQLFIREGPRQIVELYLERLWGTKLTLLSPPVNSSSDTSTSAKSPASDATYYDSAPDPQPAMASRTPRNPVTFGDALYKAGQPALHLGTWDVSDNLSANQPWVRQRCGSEQKVVAALRRQAHSHSLVVLQLGALRRLQNDALARQRKVLDVLRELCVVFVGPLDPGYGRNDVRKMFRHCGPIRSVQLIAGTHRVHAVVEFELLEGAVLAVETTYSVRRPVKTSTLDMEEWLNELREELRSCHTVFISNIPTHSADDLRTTFSKFGPISDVRLHEKPGRRKRSHAFIRYGTNEAVEAALTSPAWLLDRKLAVCRAVTPLHLTSWCHSASLTTEEASIGNEMEEEDKGSGLEDVAMEMRTLDTNVGKLFKALSDNTLSIIILPGEEGDHVSYPGLCFLEVKQSQQTHPG